MHSKQAFAQIVKLTKSDNERVSLSACQEVLNRAYGKPEQSVSIDSQPVREIAELSDAELMAIVRGHGDEGPQVH